jgi:glutamyl-tRNA synthetase
MRPAGIESAYRGRLAPSPTGYLHLGHARTFWTAWERARNARGALILRDEDLDSARVRQEYRAAMIEDLRWLGLDWQEGPDAGGPFAPYVQSERFDCYRDAFERLKRAGCLFPCRCSRSDVRRALAAPHSGDEEPVYPGSCRATAVSPEEAPNWRFRVPDGEEIAFVDGRFGPQRFVAGCDFGDFVVWRAHAAASGAASETEPGAQAGGPSYQLAVVVDDALMRVTEVVRGADLLLSTARQLLIYRALGWPPPAFYHCPLVTDEKGARLAKRHDSLSLRCLREAGANPRDLVAGFRREASAS